MAKLGEQLTVLDNGSTSALSFCCALYQVFGSMSDLYFILLILFFICGAASNQ